mmetsp:Transcript_12735/g.20611  ORF Transcript_12735/g.20611 Transcript_12735/m.20611 type:complete len:217 (-) Transcript_12735:973-1623(-)
MQYVIIIPRQSSNIICAPFPKFYHLIKSHLSASKFGNASLGTHHTTSSSSSAIPSTTSSSPSTTATTTSSAAVPATTTTHVTTTSSSSSSAATSSSTTTTSTSSPVIRIIHAKSPIHNISPRHQHSLIRTLSLRKLNVSKPLKVSSLTIRRESNIGNLTTFLEGFAESILFNVEGEVSDEDGHASFLFLRDGTCFVDGFVGGVFDAEPSATVVGSV